MIKSKVTFKQLEAFTLVVDTGTFRAAADTLGTTQPNISARISALETTLGAALLIRDRGAVRLTAKGEVLLEKARDVLWAGEALLEEAGRHDLIDETLRLGVTELVACTWLQGFLRILKAEYPALRVQLEVDLSTVIEQRLGEGQLDLAFQTGPFSYDKMEGHPLGVEPYCWVANPILAQKMGARPALEQVFAYTILTHAKHTQAGHALHQLAQDQGLAGAAIVHSSALSACLPMVLEGLGTALLPVRLVRGYVEKGQLIPVAVDWLPDPLCFFARYVKARSPRYVRHAAEMARQAAAKDIQDQ